MALSGQTGDDADCPPKEAAHKARDCCKGVTAAIRIQLEERPMLTLYSYPELFGVADNNGYGLKVYAFLKLAGVPFVHEHVFDASAAPRGQLPYIVDDGETIGDSETILAHLIQKYRLSIDAALTPAQRTTD